MGLIPLLETAQGVLNAFEIAMASSRTVALAFGALDFTRELGAKLPIEGTKVLYARSRIVLAATAAGVQAIDSRWIRLADIDGLTREAQRVRQLGFRGKLVIHLERVVPVNKAFSPSEAEIAETSRILKAFREAEQRGLAAISLDGKMVDVGNARQAADTVARAEAVSDRKRE